MQKASEHTLLDLCVLHMRDIQLQQLYIRYWSWNYTDVSGFQRSTKHPGLPTEGRKAEQTALQEHNGAILSKWWGRTFTMAGNTALNSNRRPGHSSAEFKSNFESLLRTNSGAANCALTFTVDKQIAKLKKFIKGEGEFLRTPCVAIAS